MHLRGDLCNYMYVGFFQGELGEPGSDGKDGARGSLVSYHYSTFVVRTNSHQQMKPLLVETRGHQNDEDALYDDATSKEKRETRTKQ